MFNPEKPPALSVTRWLNSKEPLSLEALKGRVVVLVAFQMLCPGCVSHALPLAKRISRQFRNDEVAVIGLHSVFEHHKAMTPEALEAFVHEYQWSFPIAIDEPDGEEMPKTMAAYEMQGTPTMLLFDRQGRLRRHYLGQVDEIRLAAEIMGLAIDDLDAPRESSVKIERKLMGVLVDPAGDHDHDHHHHDHGHDHGGDCCGGHHHGHDHDPDHAHDHGHGHGAARK